MRSLPGTLDLKKNTCTLKVYYITYLKISSQRKKDFDKAYLFVIGALHNGHRIPVYLGFD
jgi:hypothetical protein